MKFPEGGGFFYASFLVGGFRRFARTDGIQKRKAGFMKKAAPSVN